MKNFKKVMALVLSVMMVIAVLASCTGKRSFDPKPADDGSMTLLIGGVGPLTGDYANYGISAKNGATIAVDEINAAGGINGMKLALNYQDSAADATQALSAFGYLQDQGMVLSLGGVLSGETAAIVAAAKDDGMFILTPTGSAKACIEGNDNAFRVCFNDPQQGTISADFISENDLAKKVAVFYQSDLDYSNGLYETFKAECAVKGIEIAVEQTFTKDTNTDMTTQITAIKNADVDLVFIPIYASDAATFLTQAQNAGLNDVVFFGCDGIDGITEKIKDDNSIIEGLMMLTPFSADSKNEKVVSFVKAYNEKFGKDPDQFAADGYDAVYVMKAAIEEAKITSEDYAEFQSRIVAAMTIITVEGITGTMKWTADGENQKNAMALVYRDGVAVSYTKD